MTNKEKIKYGITPLGLSTSCPYHMPGYHGDFAVGSASCQYNCSCFVEINEGEKYVVCNPSTSNIEDMKKRLKDFKQLFGLW